MLTIGTDKTVAHFTFPLDSARGLPFHVPVVLQSHVSEEQWASLRHGVSLLRCQHDRDAAEILAHHKRKFCVTLSAIAFVSGLGAIFGHPGCISVLLTCVSVAPLYWPNILSIELDLCAKYQTMLTDVVRRVVPDIDLTWSVGLTMAGTKLNKVE